MWSDAASILAITRTDVTDIAPSIVSTQPCKLCDDGVATIGHRFENFPYGDGEAAVTLQAYIPIWSCVGCGGSYYDEDAEKRIHIAVCDLL